MLWFGSNGAGTRWIADEQENPGLAPSRSSGGSRAANADGAPRKHGAFHSSQPGKSQSPRYPAVSSGRRRGDAAGPGFRQRSAPGSTSRVTTLPAPITAPSPIVTPGRMMAPPPIQTSLPIRTGRPNSRPSRRVSASRGMVGGIDLHRRPDLGAVADADFDHVEDDAVEVQEDAVAETDVVAEVAVERRTDHGARADMAEALATAARAAPIPAAPAPHCSAPAMPWSRPARRRFRRRGDRVRPPASSAFRSCSTDRSQLRKRVRRRGQRRAGPGAVVVHLAHQRFDGVELQFVADEADEGDVERRCHRGRP